MRKYLLMLCFLLMMSVLPHTALAEDQRDHSDPTLHQPVAGYTMEEFLKLYPTLAEGPQEISDPTLLQPLADYTLQELHARFPTLTEEQLSRFEVRAYDGADAGTTWQTQATYDGCASMFLFFDINQTEEGFTTVWCTPWEMGELVQLYESVRPPEEALVVARMHLARVILREIQVKPTGPLFVSAYGWEALDPGKFLSVRYFLTPLNQGGEDQPLRWAFEFFYPTDLSRADSPANKHWYTVELDAQTLELWDDFTVEMFLR